MQTMVPVSSDGRIVYNNYPTQYKDSPLRPPNILAADFLGQKLCVKIPRVIEGEGLGDLALIWEEKCVIRFYCREKSNTVKGDGTYDNPFNSLGDALDLIGCLGGACPDYFQVIFFPDSEEIDLRKYSEKIPVVNYRPIILGDFGAEERLDMIWHNYFYGLYAPRFIAGFNVKPGYIEQSCEYCSFFNCLFSGHFYSFIPALLINSTVNDSSLDLYNYDSIWGSDIKARSVRGDMRSYTTLNGFIGHSNITCSSMSAFSVFDSFINIENTEEVGLNFLCKVKSSHIYMFSSHITVRDFILDSDIKYEGNFESGTYSVIYGKSGIVISNVSVSATLECDLNSNYNRCVLIGLSTTEENYQINQFSCSLNVSVYGGYLSYGHTASCVIAVYKKGCMADCNIQPFGDPSGISVSCVDIFDTRSHYYCDSDFY